MKKTMVLAALLAVVAGGCKKKRPEEGTGGPPEMGSAVPGPGSATAGGSGSAGSAGSAAPAKPLTADELAKRIDQCWGYFNDSKWDDFKGCYTADGVSEAPGAPMPPATGGDAIVAYVKGYKDAFPDMKGEQVLELISGHTEVVVSLMTGTNTGPMKTPMGEMPATKNKIGIMMGQVFDIDDTGRAKRESAYFDLGTMMGQMKPDPKMPARAVIDKAPMAKEVVIAKDDAKEKANTETAKKVADTFSKHDVKAFGELLTEDAMWSEAPNPKDWNKKDTLANAQTFWKAFGDVKISLGQTWAAGDYVATTGNVEGTNDGDFAEMHLKKTGKKVSIPFLMVFKIDGGKVKNAWLFDQGLAFAMQLGMLPAPGAAPAGDKPAGDKPADKK